MTRIGESFARLEDPRLLKGQGRYTADIAPHGVAHAYVLRSPHAHARVRAIDCTHARAMSGVLAVLTGADVIREKLAGLPCVAHPPQTLFKADQPILATGKVRHVGEAVALVVAETLAQAKDAAELISIDYAALPAATLADALAADAPRVWDEADSNIAFRIERGNAEASTRAFARAAHVSTLALHHPRASANSIEPRAAIAIPEADRTTLYSTTQIPFQVREVVCAVLGIPELDLRVVAPDVGGGFGMKAQIYPEEALVVWAARKLARAVKWQGERSECLASDQHGRHQIAHARLALDADGKALALQVDVTIDLGAYLGNSAGVPPLNAAISYTSCYDIPLIHARVAAVYTNTGPLGPYRGSGKPEASYLTERLIEKAAREMRIDPIELRRRNLIPATAMPYTTPGGYVFDACDFARVLDRALIESDWAGFPARRTAGAKKRGIGLAMHCQRAGSLSERMEIRIARSGEVALHVATVSTGQGHETSFAQMIGDWLGVVPDKVRVLQGDTERLLYGRGTFAQRSMIAGGSALKLAADQVIERGKRIAAWMLEAAESDITFERGMFRVGGTDRQVSFAAVAEKAYAAPGVPAHLGIGLDGAGTHLGPNTFPNGCMVCEAEVDIETGRLALVRLTSVDDCGTVINPLTLEGQLHGSLAQGIGQALLEAVVHEPGSGQLLSGSFLDYAMPRADDMPEVTASFVEPVPTATNPLGVKGGSEAGNVGAPAAIVNAIIDALSEYGVTELPLPATPERVLAAISSVSSIRSRR